MTEIRTFCNGELESMTYSSQKKLPLILGALVITLGGWINFVRFIWDIPISFGSFVFPGWTGGIAFLLASLLAVFMFRSIYSKEIIIEKEVVITEPEKEDPPL